MANRVIKRFFKNVSVPVAGIELGGIMGQNYQNSNVSGYIQRITFERVTGSAAQITSVQIRYESENDNYAFLVYTNTSQNLTSGNLTLSDLKAPFSLMKPDSYEDIILYVATDSASAFNIRVDLEAFM